MKGLDPRSRLERMKLIKANLARVYSAEPLKLSEWMKDQIRTLKAQDNSEQSKQDQ
jgi:hypothetical protein